MAQDQSAYYFQHDADMRNDVKVKALRRRFSHKGYALWCFLLETLVDDDYHGIGFSDIDKELLAADYDVTVEELRAVVNYCCYVGLLQISEDGNRLYCDSLARRFAALEELRDKRSKAGKAGMAKRWEKTYHSHNNVITTDNTPISSDNRVEYSRVEKSKEKEKEKENSTFSPPSVDEVADYCNERNNGIDPEAFVAFYESKGWMVGKNKMKSWQAAVRTWERRPENSGGTKSPQSPNLGVGEYIESVTGRRTYGSGRYTVPPTAPARPSEQHFWDAETQAWIVI